MLETSPKFKELVILVQSLHFILEEMETWGTDVTGTVCKAEEQVGDATDPGL